MALLQFTKKGIYCKRAGVYIDPWRKVDRAIVTHGHSDHARWGMKHYLCHTDTEPIIKARLGQDISTETKGYGEAFTINGVEFSLHPAGHVVGSAQVRVAYKGDVWVVSGDYKTQDDGLSTPFEPIPCRVFITECTFGLPIYKWKSQQTVFDGINAWWQQNKEAGKVSILTGYSLGKAQRLLQNVDHRIGPILTHGAVENMNQVLRDHGITLTDTIPVTKDTDKKHFKDALVIAPPSVIGNAWLKKFAPYSTAMASGWMALRGARRWRSADRGFILSDHADWDGLNEAVKATGAETVITTHGYTSVFTRWLNEQGIQALEEHTEFEGEQNKEPEAAEGQQQA